jgi:hypothetical protein
MSKKKADKKSQATDREHNKVGAAPQVPNIKSWGRN